MRIIFGILFIFIPSTFYAQNDSLVNALDQIHHDDQVYRHMMDSVVNQFGRDSKELTELWMKQKRNDSINQVKVELLFKKYGYPGSTLVGSQHSSTAFLVIQHAPLQMQEKYLPMLTEEAEKGELPWSSLALLIDRIRVRNGKPQLYGTQISVTKRGRYVPHEIEDEPCVDKRRAEVGLGTMAEYLSWWGAKYKNKGKCE